MDSAPKPLQTLVDRFDSDAFDNPDGHARIRLEVSGQGSWDAVIEDQEAALEPAEEGTRADALLSADAASWRRMAADVRGGMAAFAAGKLAVRHNLHLGVGLLAATSGMTGPERLRFDRVETEAGSISYLEAGRGDPVILLHGLGATKASFLPTVAALADSHRTIALDLPGFGDSAKPLGAPYDARFFAQAVRATLDALDLPRAHLIGNSMGGRVALEVGMRHPDRVGRLVLLTTALAWRRDRPWAPVLRLLRPELGLLQIAPHRAVEGIVRRLVPGAQDGWSAAGVDEFLRSYLTARGRAAFYAAARSIYLDEPDGDHGFWTRLRELEPDTLFVWGRQDKLVPIAFARHVEEALPAARHLELNCGHVPQLERPRQTHAAIRSFLAEATMPVVAKRRARARSAGG